MWSIIYGRLRWVLKIINSNPFRKFKQAQAALRDALRYGAPDTEIERLMADLRQAMDDYIHALAEKAQDKSKSSNHNLSRSNLSEDSLEKKLDLIEEMAKTGSSVAAEQLLAEIEQTLDHLQVQKGNQGSKQNQSQSAQMKEKMDKLGDLMRRQQEILNETHQLEMEQRRGENVPEKQKNLYKNVNPNCSLNYQR